MSLPGIVTLARSRDDADPQWKWLWDRLAVAWVPDVDPSVMVTPTGALPTVAHQPANWFGGRWVGGNASGLRAYLSPDTATVASLQAGHTLFAALTASGSGGNAETGIACLAGNGGASYSYLFSSGNTLGVGHYIPTAFDGAYYNRTNTLRQRHLASVASGNRRFFLDGRLQVTKTQSVSLNLSTPFFEVGENSGNHWGQFQYHICAAFYGAMSDVEAATFDRALATDAPFRWRRRIVYSISAGGGPINYDQAAAGALSFAGALAKITSKQVAGAVTFAGVLVRTTVKPTAGALSPSGTIQRITQRALAGALSPSGALVTGLAYNRSVSGALTPTGDLVASATRGVTGELSFAGALARAMTRPITGTLSFAGAIQANLAVTKTTAGTLSFGGDLITQYNPPAPGGGGALQRTQD